MNTFFSAAGIPEQKEENNNEATPLPCSRAFPRRLCVRAPLTNVELEMWIQ
jgi:hypothetical protein